MGSLGTWMAWPFSIMIFFFAFSSILGAYAYADANMVFLGWTSKIWERGAQALAVLSSGVGAILAVPFVWTLMDSAMAFVTVLNLIGVLALTRWITGALKDFDGQHKQGNEPVFNEDTASLPSRLPTNGWVLTE